MTLTYLYVFNFVILVLTQDICIGLIGEVK